MSACRARGPAPPTRGSGPEVCLPRPQGPGIPGVRCVSNLQRTLAQETVDVLVWEEAFTPRLCPLPLLDNEILDTPHRLFFRDTGIGDTAELTLGKSELVGRTQVSVVRDALVEVVRDEVEDILLEISTSTGDRMDLSLTDHLGEGDAELSGTHRTSYCKDHLPATIDMVTV